MRLALRVQPGARRTALLMRMPSGEWKLSVSAPPVEGRANDAVVELMSDLLGVRRSQVTLVRGSSARSKVVEIEGLSAAEAEQRLAGHLPNAGPPADRSGERGPGGTDDE